MKVIVKSGFKVLKNGKKIDYPSSDKVIEISDDLYSKVKDYVDIVKDKKEASN